MIYKENYAGLLSNKDKSARDLHCARQNPAMDRCIHVESCPLRHQGIRASEKLQQPMCWHHHLHKWCISWM